MRALVTGGNGFIGSQLVRRLGEQGHDVRAMCRKSSDRSRLEGLACEIGFADMTDPASLVAVLDGVDVVYHCAAALGAPTQEAFDAVNATGTDHLVQAILQHRPELKRFVLISSIAAGGPSTRERARTEADEAAPTSQYGKSKLAGEQRLDRLRDTVPVTIVRPPIVYGPGNLSLLPLFRAVKRGVIAEIGGPQRRLSYVEVRDLVEGTIVAGTHPDAEGEVFHVIGPDNGTLLEFQRSIAQAMGRKAIALRPPVALMKFAGWAFDRVKAATNIKHSFGSDKIRDGLAESWVVDDSKIRDRLGFKPKIGFGAGTRATVADYEQQGWL